MDIQTLDPAMVVIGVVVLILLFWILKKGLMLVIYLVAALVIGYVGWSVYNGGSPF